MKGETVIDAAHSSGWGTGNRIRRRDHSERRYRYEPYFAIKVRPYIGAGEPMCMVTFVSLNHEWDIELHGTALAELRAALDAETWQLGEAAGE